ncbi:hypothetical protein [uncultured Chryseobacterium sp.]|uniref:hypothetical protein n=1 Tax=uncultured Chryseobacterium sp. TaxID=259322 RepID=UPI0026029D62|nr:hypothetical protein [uncultured Chryseobacterium sp.]
MELDNIKDLWKKEEVSETPEISTEQQSEIHNPLQKIRKNLWMEICLNIVVLITLIPLSKVFSENPLLRWTLMIIYFFIIGYFTLKFYKFYKKVNLLGTNTLYHLQGLKFELILLKELYKAYYVSNIPFFMGVLFLFLQKNDFSKYPDLIMSYAPYIIFFCIVAFTLGFGVWWFENYYGKHIKQIQKIIDELK